MLSDQALCQDPKGGQESAPTNPPLRTHHMRVYATAVDRLGGGNRCLLDADVVKRPCRVLAVRDHGHSNLPAHYRVVGQCVVTVLDGGAEVAVVRERVARVRAAAAREYQVGADVVVGQLVVSDCSTRAAGNQDASRLNLADRIRSADSRQVTQIVRYGVVGEGRDGASQDFDAVW